jgi:hypothetical protein
MATNVQSVQQHFDECHNFADSDQCCPVCQLTFVDIDTLTDHVNSAHFVGMSGQFAFCDIIVVEI